MEFGKCVSKTFLIILNIIVFAVGIIVIALASVVISESGEYGHLLTQGNVALPIWTLIVGIVITLIGFFGCFGAARENSCMLYTYGSIVAILFIAEITLGILVAVMPQNTSQQLKNGIDQAFKSYKGSDDSLDEDVEDMQHVLQCCGVDGPNDWYSYPYGSVPNSCCKVNDCDTRSPTATFSTGCFNAIFNKMKGVTVALGVTAILLAIVQVLCIVIACYLAKKNATTV